MAVYCCTAATCPNGSTCQFPGGNYGRCGMPGQPDGGVDICPFVNCTAGGVNRCMMVGCTQCMGGGGGGAKSCAK